MDAPMEMTYHEGPDGMLYPALTPVPEHDGGWRNGYPGLLESRTFFYQAGQIRGNRAV